MNASLASTFLPDPGQELLLHAALRQGTTALSAWDAWKRSVDLDSIDGASFRLMPLLYRNLLSMRVRDPLMGRLKGMYRQTWYRNQLAFHRCAAALHMLHAAGIETMLLKGPALTLQYYRDPGVRPMGDVDVLVRPAQAAAAMTRLQSGGWKLARKYQKSAKDQIPLRHAADFVDDLNIKLDLHWNLLPGAGATMHEEELWERSVPLRIESVVTRALGPADQLLHICAHGARWNPLPPVRWVADAYVVARVSASALDWDCVTEQAIRREMAFPIHSMLVFLRDRFEQPVPQDALDCLTAVPRTSRLEREYAAYSRPNRLWGFMLATYYDVGHRDNDAGIIRRAWNLARYLRFEWDVPHLWQVPFVGLQRCYHRLRS